MADNPESVTISVDTLSLSNLGDGLANEQFQAIIAAFLRCVTEHEDKIDDGGVYQTKEDILRAQAVLTVDLVRDIASGATEIGWSFSEKPPARRGGRKAVIVRSGQMLVDNDGTQIALLKSTKRQEK